MPLQREPLARRLPAHLRVDLADAADRRRHARRVVDEEPGAAVLDHFGSAPCGNAITGVPQPAASIATSELVSGARLGTSRQRAAASSRRLRAKPTGPSSAARGPGAARPRCAK